MKLSEVVAALDLTPLVDLQDGDVSGAYCADLLSDVVGNAQAGNVLVTVQVHRNVVAVSSLVGLGAVIITHGRVPEEAVREAARENGVNLLSSAETSFTIAGRLYELGVRSA
jgi:predicted transcriptional regulator